MSRSSTHKCESIMELLKKSLVPVPCQECMLNAKGCTNSENIEWLLDLKDKIPIWSRLNEINTSGFKRKLPMSMTKNYDIEIKGRLWSLWGHELKYRKPQSHSKSYMAITVMALCAARVISLNVWNTSLMDSIRDNGRKYYKKSLKETKCCRKEFKLEYLVSECNLEGIGFKVYRKKVQQGYLYSIPLKCHSNLAYALKQFFASYRFGILECYNRILGFGYIDGPSGGYFMYDAQSLSYPLFPKNVSAPYVLRTNHLQVLLYCLIVSLNVTQMHACFSLHHVQINIVEANEAKMDNNSSTSICLQPSISPTNNLQITPDLSLKASLSKSNLQEELSKPKSIDCTDKLPTATTSKSKYRRKLHNITKEEEEKSIIKPLVDADRKSDEDVQIKKDFVRMICSDTILSLTPAELAGREKNEFSCNLLDALVMGPKTCLAFNEI